MQLWTYEFRFKDGPTELNRRKWDDRRDCVVICQATNDDDARRLAFDLARAVITNPFME